MSYTYKDNTDEVLSALERAKKLRKKGIAERKKHNKFEAKNGEAKFEKPEKVKK